MYTECEHGWMVWDGKCLHPDGSAWGDSSAPPCPVCGAPVEDVDGVCDYVGADWHRKEDG